MSTVIAAVIGLFVVAAFAISSAVISRLGRVSSLRDEVDQKLSAVLCPNTGVNTADARRFCQCADMEEVSNTVLTLCCEVVELLQIPLRNVRIGIYCTPLYLIVSIGDTRVLLDGGKISDLDVYVGHVSPRGKVIECVINRHNLTLKVTQHDRS